MQTNAFSTKDFIDSEIEKFRAFIREQLPPYIQPRMGNIICMFFLYDRIVRTYFILWLMLTLKKANTTKGKEVAAENLKCEIEENHPQMLLEVIANIIGKTPDILLTQKYYQQTRTAYHEVSDSLETLTLHCSTRGNGFFLMALLENGSLDFIPWMEQAADHRLGVKPENLKYFQVHGEADKQHATQFTAACVEELDDYYRTETAVKEMQNPIQSVRRETERVFLHIFSLLSKEM